MKRITVIVPLLLPRLSDQAAAQLVELLRALFDIVEHHYAAQLQRDRKRQCKTQPDPSTGASNSPADPPF